MVYLKDGMLNVGFGGSSMTFGEMQYTLGDDAANFSMFPDSDIKLRLATFRSEFF